MLARFEVNVMVPRPFRRRLGWSLLAAVGGALYAWPGVAGDVPAVAASQHSAVRLLDGGRQVDGGWMAGVEIRIDPGFITYWRSAGEAGVPPVFDTSASTNVKSLTIDYPAPRLIDEDGTQAYGYDADVVFPVQITPRDAAVPVKLDLSLDYAVCSKLCLPSKAHVALTLGAARPEASAAIRAAESDVPKAAALGQGGLVRIDAVTWSGPASIVVEASVPDRAGTLFVEAPDPWYFSASAGRPGADGHIGFVLTEPDHPPSGPLPKDPLRLTLVTPSGSIDVSVPLDAVGAKP